MCDQGALCGFAHGEHEMRTKNDPLPEMDELLRLALGGSLSPEMRVTSPPVHAPPGVTASGQHGKEMQNGTKTQYGGSAGNGTSGWSHTQVDDSWDSPPTESPTPFPILDRPHAQLPRSYGAPPTAAPAPVAALVNPTKPHFGALATHPVPSYKQPGTPASAGEKHTMHKMRAQYSFNHGVLLDPSAQQCHPSTLSIFPSSGCRPSRDVELRIPPA